MSSAFNSVCLIRLSESATAASNERGRPSQLRNEPDFSVTAATGKTTFARAVTALGAISSVLCSLAVGLKYKIGYDDSLDVVGVHLVGGLSGSLLVGIFATAAAPAGVDGLLYGGGSGQLVKQAIACGAVLAYSFIATLIIGYAIEKTIGFRVTREVEIEGIDLKEHAESAYELASSSRGGASL